MLLFHLFLVPWLCLATSVGWVESDSFPNPPTAWNQPFGTTTEDTWGVTSTDTHLGQGVHLHNSSPSGEGQNSGCQERTHTCPACLNHSGPVRGAHGRVGEEAILGGHGRWLWDQHPAKLGKRIPPAMTRRAPALRLLHDKYALENRENTHIFNLIALKYWGHHAGRTHLFRACKYAVSTNCLASVMMLRRDESDSTSETSAPKKKRRKSRN